MSGDRLVVYTKLYADSPAVWEQTSVHIGVADTVKGPARTRTTVTFDGLGDVRRSVASAIVVVGDLPPGRYVARASVVYDSGEVVRLHRPFWIIESPASSADAR